MTIAEIRYEEARARLDKALQQVSAEEIVSADKALSRISAQSLASAINLPAQANAAVDGYCVSSAYLEKHPDHKFTLIGEAKAGHPFTGQLKDGEALWIFTGAEMPKGADCVMMQEYCDRQGQEVSFPRIMRSGYNVRPAGENLAKGEEIIAQGEVITPAHIAQVAAAGLTQIPVRRPLRVGVISTGDELSEGSEKQPLPQGQIFDSNRPLLKQLIIQAGHQVVDGGIIGDNLENLTTAYETLSQNCDVVISSGGASQGIEDHSQNAIKAIGAEILFWRVAMKPGRPVGAAMMGGVPLFLLPGNPVAVFVCFQLFVLSTLFKLSTGVFSPLKQLFIPMGVALDKKPNERTEFVRVKLALTNDGDTVMLPHGRKGAGVLSSLTGADGLAELPHEAGTINAGQKLPVILL